jgi:putative membrane protein
VAILAVLGVIACAFAELRWRRLGHALTPAYLVVQTGALTTSRTALERDGIIGWRVRQGFFDRRVGLAQLTATTAAGDESVLIPDLPLEAAVELAHSAQPRLLAEFTHPSTV